MQLPFFNASKKKSLYTLAFYNLENLFDTVNDPITLDDDFLPNAERSWNRKRYQKKLYKLSSVIVQIGSSKTNKPPSLVGVSEVENKKVLSDLVNSKKMKRFNYGIVHFDSPDERGIDVGLLYQKEHFKVITSKTISILVDNEPGVRDFTRDILHVEGLLNNEKIHVLVNHWPSRREGADSTAYKRIIAAKKNRELIQQIRAQNPASKIVVMGDFNDDPSSESIKKYLVQQDFYNPMEKLHTRYRGTLSYRSQWYSFDQIILSHSFHKFEQGKHSFNHADIFDRKYVKVFKGRYKGSPFRTYVGPDYQGGYSDHFPVFVTLKLN
ncbi:endonuclease [Aquimarina sp. W85]|uniref:endonuclease/exonuclease/phosphatase family protein n=1 Tax=Aquimarina rhodophyticola TaxID=3342246 RepID=UPI003672AE7D